MAELLIYNKTHWMDKVSQAKWNDLSSKDSWAEKYNKRYQPGCVVEIRPDGFWGQGPYPRKDVFRVLIVKGLSEKDAQYLLDGGVSRRNKHMVTSGHGKDVDTIDVADLKLDVEK